MQKTSKNSLQKERTMIYYDSVARPDGRRADNKSNRNERCGQRKFEKKFSFELAKLKNGDILKSCRVKSALVA